MLLQAPSTVAENTTVHIAVDTHLADADLVLLSVSGDVTLTLCCNVFQVSHDKPVGNGLELGEEDLLQLVFAAARTPQHDDVGSTQQQPTSANSIDMPGRSL